jgi:RecA-family ATPase
LKPQFSRVNTRGTRAVCPQDGCGKDFSVSINEEFSYCHRCHKHWYHNDMEKIEERPPELVNTRTPVFIRGNKAREQAKYDEARAVFLEHFDLIVKHEQLPWPEKAKEYGIGARNKGDDEVQLIFEIDEDHYKFHKGQQFGNADCKIYPMSVLPQLQTNSTLLVVEGEKDAITANSNGAPAITFTSGAGALPRDISSIEKFTKLVICYDNDEKGVEGASKVAMELYKQNKTRKIKILKWNNKPDKYDITDYFMDGYTANDLYSYADKMPVYGASAADFGGLNAYDPETFINRFQDEVVQICEEILLENGTSSISGQSNVGKSILALQFAMSVAMGVPFLTFNVPRPRKVLLVQFEMMDAHMKTRVDKCMAGMMAQYPHKIGLLRDNLLITSMENIKIFTDQYKAIEGNLMSGDFDVCVVDNLYSSSGTQLHKNDALTQLMSRIDELRKEYQCAFMMISHHKKLEEKRPLEHSMVYGGSYFVNFLDNLVQVANTGRHNQLKVFKITKIRTENEFHEVPLGIWLHTEDEQLYFQYRKPLPKNEAYWYTDPEENTEERVLNAVESEGDNFSYMQFADALEKTLKITSMKSVYKWLDKLESMGYITKIERGHYVRCANELDAFLK